MSFMHPQKMSTMKISRYTVSGYLVIQVIIRILEQDTYGAGVLPVHSVIKADVVQSMTIADAALSNTLSGGHLVRIQQYGGGLLPGLREKGRVAAFPGVNMQYKTYHQNNNNYYSICKPSFQRMTDESIV